MLPVDLPDEELQAIAEEIQKPVVFSTGVLGDLTLDCNQRCFETEATWNGTTICVTFFAGDGMPGEDARKTAESLWSDQVRWKQRIDQCAADNLLELKNDTWHQDDEPEYTADQFAARMTLTSICIEPDGRFEFWHDDGGLFFEHGIMVSGNFDDGPTSADIVG